MSVHTELKNLTVSRIYDELRSEVEKAIEKLNKKADKLGVARPNVVLGNTYVHTYTLGELNEDNIAADIEGDFKHYAVDVFDVTIKMPETIKFNGWKPIVFIDHFDKIHIQMNIEADYDYDFVSAIENNTCDHCLAKRTRRKSWVLQNEETGEFKKVGSTCVKDFTGVSPDKFFKMFQFVTDTLNSFADEDGMWNRSGKVRNPENYIVYDIDHIWTIANNVLKVDGKYIKSLWTTVDCGRFSKDVRSNEGESTSDKVREVLSRQRTRVATDIENSYFVDSNTVDTTLVEGIRNWLSNLVVRTEQRTEDVYNEKLDTYETKVITIENSYDKKLKEFADKKRTRRFDIGFLSYIVSAYNLYLETLNVPASNWVGVVGEKTNIEVTVISVNGFESAFGWFTR